MFEDPKNDEARRGLAKTCTKSLSLSLPTVVDGMDDAVNKQYGAWPERLYVVGKDGKIAFQGGPGPFQFKPLELQEFLGGYLSKSENKKEKGFRTPVRPVETSGKEKQ